MNRLEAMEVFVRVVDTGSFSGAARQLRVGQPAVSKAVAQLEERLGVRLLLRSTHGLAPTEAGQNFMSVRGGPSRRRMKRTLQRVALALGAIRPLENLRGRYIRAVARYSAPRCVFVSAS